MQHCPPATAGTGALAPAPALGPAPPPVSPAVIAQRFFDTIPLPAPHPSVPPGYAITGLPAYLVTGGDLTPSPYEKQTALGPLEVRADGTYEVNWGDGSQTGPYSAEGRAYPNGNISHTYDNVGTYTVTVTVTWTATWQLGGANGTLGGLHTAATIAGFRVRQVQAVITG